jgi:hypothetical protein
MEGMSFHIGRYDVAQKRGGEKYILIFCPDGNAFFSHAFCISPADLRVHRWDVSVSFVSTHLLEQGSRKI